MSGQLGMLQSNVSNLNTAVTTMKSDFDGLNSRLTNVTAQAVANKCGISNINKQLKDMQTKQQSSIEEKVAESIARELEKVSAAGMPAPDGSDMARRLDKIDKELDKMKTLQTGQQMASSQRPRSQTSRFSSVAEDESQQYWAARKKIRLSPVEMGNGADEATRNAYDFLENVLDMPKDEIPDGAILGVRKVPGRRKNYAQNEVIVTFDSVQTRDCVASYAPNLADWRGKNSSKAGLRLEIPDYLCGVFRVLERHAHQLKEQHQHYFKRSIKYDDVNLTLVLDYCGSKGGNWQRVTYEDAAQLIRGQGSSVRSSTNSHPGDEQSTSGNQQGTLSLIHI